MTYFSCLCYAGVQKLTKLRLPKSKIDSVYFISGKTNLDEDFARQ